MALAAMQTDCARTLKAVGELMPAKSLATWLLIHRGSSSHSWLERIYVEKALAKQVSTAQNVEFEYTDDMLKRKTL